MFVFKILYVSVHTDVLTPDTKGCPAYTRGCMSFGCPNTCYCGDRCSWERCTLTQPPEKCIQESHGTWLQNIESLYWTAETKGLFKIVYTNTLVCVLCRNINLSYKYILNCFQGNSTLTTNNTPNENILDPVIEIEKKNAEKMATEKLQGKYEMFCSF